MLFASLIFLGLIGAGYAFVAGIAPEKNFLAVLVAFLVTFVTTLLAYTVTYLGLDKKTNTFVGMLLTGMVVKMLVGLLTIVVVALRYKPIQPEYVTAFLVGYMVFTAFEVYGLIRKLRPKF